MVRATNPYAEDVEGGTVRDNVSTLETVQEGGKGRIVILLGAVGRRTD